MNVVPLNRAVETLHMGLAGARLALDNGRPGHAQVLIHQLEAAAERLPPMERPRFLGRVRALQREASWAFHRQGVA